MTKKQKELYLKILNKIYVDGPISRVEIAKQTGLTPATVSDLTSTLMKENLIYEVGIDSTGSVQSGRKRILLDIAENHSYYIGSELSEKYISFCLTDNKGEIFEEKIIPFPKNNHDEVLTETFYLNELKAFIDITKSYEPKSIGIALPGHFNIETKSIYSNNPFWQNFNLEILSENIGIPIFCKNNVHCMAIGARLFREDHIKNHFIFFHVGRGMFCSYIFEGNLYGENQYSVGEVGHMIVHPEGELCECGKRGCLQTYASEAWIIKKSRILFENSNSTFLRQLSPDKKSITIDTVLRAYVMGDEGVTNILNNAIKYLSITINNLPMMLETNKIIIHGELFKENALTHLLDHTLNQNKTFSPLTHTWDIVFKKYSSINGALAACGFAIDQYLLQDTAQ